MRLAFVETSAHGGLLQYTVQLADAVAERGHDVHLIVPRSNELAAVRGAAHRREILPPHVTAAGAAPADPLAYQLRRVGIAWRLARSWARVVWAARSGRYDAVVTGTDISISIGGIAMRALLALPNRPPVAYIVHNIRPFNRWGGDMFVTRIERRLREIYRRADAIILHGDRALAEYEELWPRRPIIIIPHGDQTVFGDDPPPTSGEERILFFGDWRKVKGLPVLMEAFDLLAARRPTVSLTIAGTPAPADFDPEPLRAWAAGHGSRVTLIDDYVPMADVPAVFATCRVVATPYLVGYQSGVMHLAQTMGRAVVTSDVGDLPASVDDGVSGFVVPAGDAPALADALEKVVADAEIAAKMGAAARERLDREASWSTVAEALEAGLREQLGLR